MNRSTAAVPPSAEGWWRSAVTYEVYLRSFADADGDGVGDIPGLRSRLPYLADLGVDALWITPWYPSPMADGGYDVSDHRDVDPAFGGLVEADALLADAHALGLRVLVDFVPNHTSETHPWFAAALAAGPGAPERERYFFREGRGPGGDEPPNDWVSAFGGPAWTRIKEEDGTPGPWYLHQFAPQQPDLDQADPAVRADLDATVRFWLERGVDGLRVDAAPAMVKTTGLPDAGHPRGTTIAANPPVDSPHWDVDGVHDVLRRWRAIADEYDDRMFVVEAIVDGPERLARYVRPDEMHTAFNFDYLRAGWDAGELRRVVDATLATLAPTGAPATWVLSSHDETRHVTRYGRRHTGVAPRGPAGSRAPATDVELGRRRARAAALFTLALPGGTYLYQGDELGLPEVEDLPEDVLADPTWERSGHTVRGRDGCRVPLPWSGDRSPFGFAPPGTRPWLPQPPDWAALTVEAQAATPGSTLLLHRAALHLRRSRPELHRPDFAWCAAATDVLVFDRGPTFRCVLNLSGAPVGLAGDGTPLLASVALGEDGLPPDAAVWLSRPEDRCAIHAELTRLATEDRAEQVERARQVAV